MAMLGEQFMVGEEITGAEISLRYTEDIISIWNKTAGSWQFESHLVEIDCICIEFSYVPLIYAE